MASGLTGNWSRLIPTSRWMMRVRRHNLQLQMILVWLTSTHCHQSKIITWIWKGSFMSAVETPSPLIHSPWQCNDGTVINYSLWHKDSNNSPADLFRQVTGMMEALQLTCKKLEVCGFHFSSGLPCHVLRILKHTWFRHKHTTKQKVRKLVSKYNPHIEELKHNIHCIGERLRFMKFMTKHLWEFLFLVLLHTCFFSKIHKTQCFPIKYLDNGAPPYYNFSGQSFIMNQTFSYIAHNNITDL